MKHGVVRSGKNTTYYGDSAVQHIASRSMHYVLTAEEAAEKILAATGKMQMALIDAARAQGFEVSADTLKRVEEVQLEEKTKAAACLVEEIKEALRYTPSLTAKTVLKIPCHFCNKPVEPGQVFKKRQRYRAHESCL